MPSEPEQKPHEITAASDEMELCVSCMFPNEPGVPFCVECGAPMTSYAATGPLESIFAEGYAYRQAAERPRSFIVVLGIWMIFGTMALTGFFLIFIGREGELQPLVVGTFLLLVSLIMIWKTTWNYIARPRGDETRNDASSDY